MNGNSIVADTNILIYLLNGNKAIKEILANVVTHISFITEIELRARKNLSEKETQLILQLISDCTVIDINDKIKNETIRLRMKYGLALPDCIILATASYLDLTLLTADKEFKKVNEPSLPIFLY